MTLSPTAYFDLYSSDRTRSWYRNCMKRYLEIVTGQRIATLDLDTAWATYLNSGVDVRRDLIQFPLLVRGQLAPMTIHQYMGATEQYLADAHGIELTRQEKRLRKRAEPDNIPITANAALTREMIAEVLRHADERLQAEILIAVSSGLRIGEIVNLQRDDVNYDSDPVEITVRRENAKNGICRTSYLSSEAVAALRAYNRVRENRHISGRGMTLKKWDDLVNSSLLFPFCREGEGRRLRDAVIRSGLGLPDPKTRRMNIHFHLFRAWFSTQAGLSGAPKDYIEDLMGHVGYLRSAYWHPTVEMRREIYKNTIEPYVTINIPDDYHAVKIKQAKELEELRAANIHNQQMISILMAQLNEVQRTQATGIRVAIQPYVGSSEDEDIND
ncbi:MAG TPA: site-specific integrase [Methanocorpusculum sp.]|nr:site-specific integrase [Methanocorpusculum sp.]